MVYNAFTNITNDRRQHSLGHQPRPHALLGCGDVAGEREMGVAAFLCFLALCGVEKLFVEGLLRSVCFHRSVVVAHRLLYVPLSAPRDGTPAPLQLGQSAECFDTYYRWLSQRPLWLPIFTCGQRVGLGFCHGLFSSQSAHRGFLGLLGHRDVL